MFWNRRGQSFRRKLVERTRKVEAIGCSERDREPQMAQMNTDPDGEALSVI